MSRSAGHDHSAPFDPAADGWVLDDEPGHIAHLGPFWERVVDGRGEYAFVVAPKHLNRNRAVHGGMLATLLDHAVGCVCFLELGEDAHLATIELGTHFIREARLGDFVVCRVSVVRTTAMILFLRGEAVVGDTVIFTGDAIVKRRRRPHAAAAPEARNAQA